MDVIPMGEEQPERSLYHAMLALMNTARAFEEKTIYITTGREEKCLK